MKMGNRGVKVNTLHKLTESRVVCFRNTECCFVFSLLALQQKSTGKESNPWLALCLDQIVTSCPLLLYHMKRESFPCA